jgi:hypothetical protein
MSDSPSSTSSIRKRGAPLGNQNALKHGFYAIKAEVLARLSTDIKGEFLDEIEVLRSLVDTNLKVFNANEHPTLEQCQTTLRGISQSFDTMKGLYLMQKVLYNNQTSIEQALEELADIPPEQD